ncbi:thiamine pyrophosphate-binding protein [Streptomyces sp. ICN988]|uniref:thiamine pyrophosphate-binding protein n=1 Tax=Streptomyces sp. ICN988 TaxID=2983765 RepID=UPI0021E4801E|nr:thiamine pyrophosphate-binding protein [Streptomyces sp. ICN988]MCV2458433.1 thiamine pyrophosphate-binding protein [Streptomyces sp. ICN988]
MSYSLPPLDSSISILESEIADSLRDEVTGDLSPVRCARLVAGGTERAADLVSEMIQARHAVFPEIKEAARRVVDRILTWPLVLTGSEVVGAVLATHGVEVVFCYPGTSELDLCDAVDAHEDIRLVNGRGDRESVFMAGGASLIEPNRAAAIVHGARGLTNALGAIADIRRSETGLVVVVGLPSTSSAKFLPPHGEPGLIEAGARFAKYAWEAPAVPSSDDERSTAGRVFVERLHDAFRNASRPARGPALFGIPQNVAEQRWISLSDLAAFDTIPVPNPLDDVLLSSGAAILRESERPVVLIDDYALRHSGMREKLDDLSQILGAPVVQARYRRGPMLFERLHENEVKHFIGWLDPSSEQQADLLTEADLLITVEDRNLYPRVVGDLPNCRKLAVTSDPGKTRKNEYLTEADVLLAGDPVDTLAALIDELSLEGNYRMPWFVPDVCSAGPDVSEKPDSRVLHARRALCVELMHVLRGWPNSVLVDDSQMFGGLLAENYDEFAPGLRVFGGHGAFVGAGLSQAIGLAIANPETRVICTLGDQGFTNAYQGLVAASDTSAPVLFLVCNNGESVSLGKQARASLGSAPRRYLANADGFNYHEVAKAHGLPSFRVPVPIGAELEEFQDALTVLTRTLEHAATAAAAGPVLIELILPSEPRAWRGIWKTDGFEKSSETSR